MIISSEEGYQASSCGINHHHMHLSQHTTKLHRFYRSKSIYPSIPPRFLSAHAWLKYLWVSSHFHNISLPYHLVIMFVSANLLIISSCYVYLAVPCMIVVRRKRTAAHRLLIYISRLALLCKNTPSHVVHRSLLYLYNTLLLILLRLYGTTHTGRI